jgi:aspartyl-tRNA(Asn)/glutamyl-tRNA(Gln) amidotransferase subunit A
MHTTTEDMSTVEINTSEPLFYQDATELAKLVRTKQVSPVEIVQTHLDRIEAVNPKINAIVTLMADDALKTAKEAEAAVLKGEELGVFHGIPFTIKDAIDTEGVLTQAGSKVFAGNFPATDATAVMRFKKAGGIPLAKTNVPEFSAWWETDNLVTGRTNNPWDLTRTPGGSSGGESAAIAAGISPIGLGSDVAISVRGPAALTGIVGLKATLGRIPYTGHLPPYLGRYWHIGPMARSMRDIAAAFSVLSGPDGIDPYAVYAKDAGGPDIVAAGKPVRVGWMAEEGFGIVDREIADTVKAVAELLADRGNDVEQVRIPILEQNDFVQTAMTLFMGEMLPQFRLMVAGYKNDLHAIGSLYANMPDPSLSDFVEAQGKVEKLRSVFVGYFQKYDVLLIPVLPLTAPPHGQQEYVINGQNVPPAHMMRATAPFNLTGLPALSVPYGFSSENLPINVQLVSKWLDETTILQLGALIEGANTSRNRRPNL